MRIRRSRSPWYLAHCGDYPPRQDACIRTRLKIIHKLFHRDNGTPGSEDGFLLHAQYSPEKDVSLAVCFLGVNDGDIGTERWHGDQLFSGEGADDVAYVRIVVCQFNAGIPAHHGE